MFRYQVNRCNEIGFKLLFFIVLMLVTWQALTPQMLEPVESINDKLGHALVFLLLAAISDHAYATTRYNLKKIVLLMLYGISIEIIQHYVPGRTFSFLDMLADGSGLLVYWLVAHYIVVRTPTPVSEQDTF